MINVSKKLEFKIAKYLRQYGSSLAELRKGEETKVIK